MSLTVAAPNAESGSISSFRPFARHRLERRLHRDGNGSRWNAQRRWRCDYDNSYKDELDLYIDQPASSPPTPTPSTDYSQLTAGGTVNLNNVELDLTLGSDSEGNCYDLVPGQVYTLISAATISGELDSVGGSPLADGETTQIADGCNYRAAAYPSSSVATVRINYDTSDSPETVTATVVPGGGGHAGDFPALTGATPTFRHASARRLSAASVGRGLERYQPDQLRLLLVLVFYVRRSGLRQPGR